MASLGSLIYGAIVEGPSVSIDKIPMKMALQNPQHNAVFCNFSLSENKTTERQHGRPSVRQLSSSERKSGESEFEFQLLPSHEIIK